MGTRGLTTSAYEPLARRLASVGVHGEARVSDGEEITSDGEGRECVCEGGGRAIDDPQLSPV